MKTYRTSSGPVSEAVYYKPQEIEEICTDELRKADFYPKKPEPIRIERFVENRFQVTPEYVDLKDGVLGYTAFGSRGVEGIFISRALVEADSRPADRRATSTLAHEAGHGLLHAHLFAFEQSRLTSLFGSDFDPAAPKILCRDPRPQASRGRYDGRWWEFHANQAIGALLMPRSLALEAISDLLAPAGVFGSPTLPDDKRERAVRHLADTFEVNPAVARIRIEDLFPEGRTGQLTL